MTTYTGKVKFFNFKKGFGFITRTGEGNEGDDLFVHRVDIKGNPLKEGDEVTYLVKMDEVKKKEFAAEVDGGSGYPFGQKGRGKRGEKKEGEAKDGAKEGEEKDAAADTDAKKPRKGRKGRGKGARKGKGKKEEGKSDEAAPAAAVEAA